MGADLVVLQIGTYDEANYTWDEIRIEGILTRGYMKK
jgi:hypothetical protein